MPPLISPSVCDSCLRLSQTVEELQRRMSSLYQVREVERFLDSLFAENVTTTVPTVVQLDLAILAGSPWLEGTIVVTDYNDTELDNTIPAAQAQPEDQKKLSGPLHSNCRGLSSVAAEAGKHVPCRTNHFSAHGAKPIATPARSSGAPTRR